MVGHYWSTSKNQAPLCAIKFMSILRFRYQILEGLAGAGAGSPSVGLDGGVWGGGVTTLAIV